MFRRNAYGSCPYLEGLTDARWGAPSLCSAWTVRAVVAHLNLASRAGLGDFVVAAIRASGSFNRTMDELAVKHAAALTPVGLHLIASDLDWSSGAGREVRGVAEGLLLVTAGRRAGLPGLTGPGVDLLAERLG